MSAVAKPIMTVVDSFIKARHERWAQSVWLGAGMCQESNGDTVGQVWTLIVMNVTGPTDGAIAREIFWPSCV